MMITLRSILDEIIEHNCVYDRDKYHTPLNDMDAVDSLATTIANLHERQAYQNNASCAVAYFESNDKTKFIMSCVTVAEDDNGMPFYNAKAVSNSDGGTPNDVGSRYCSLAMSELWYKFSSLCVDIRSLCLVVRDILV